MNDIPADAAPTTEDGAQRIDAIVSSGDGFEIAERDLVIRGPGELFGARQSGLAPFLAADLVREFSESKDPTVARAARMALQRIDPGK